MPITLRDEFYKRSKGRMKFKNLFWKLCRKKCKPAYATSERIK